LRPPGIQIVISTSAHVVFEEGAPLFGTVYLRTHDGIISRQVADFSAGAPDHSGELTVEEHSTFSTSTALKAETPFHVSPFPAGESGGFLPLARRLP